MAAEQKAAARVRVTYYVRCDLQLLTLNVLTCPLQPVPGGLPSLNEVLMTRRSLRPTTYHHLTLIS
jgi:hypothetical protein